MHPTKPLLFKYQTEPRCNAYNPTEHSQYRNQTEPLCSSIRLNFSVPVKVQLNIPNTRIKLNLSLFQTDLSLDMYLVYITELTVPISARTFSTNLNSLPVGT